MTMDATEHAAALRLGLQPDAGMLVCGRWEGAEPLPYADARIVAVLPDGRLRCADLSWVPPEYAGHDDLYVLHRDGDGWADEDGLHVTIAPDLTDPATYLLALRQWLVRRSPFRHPSVNDADVAEEGMPLAPARLAALLTETAEVAP